jgi:hypothetical protein
MENASIPPATPLGHLHFMENLQPRSQFNILTADDYLSMLDESVTVERIEGQ